MRAGMSIVLLAVLVALSGHARAEEPDEPDEPISSREVARDQIQALHDLEHAETDEDAEEAAQRFNEASDREVQRRRALVDDLIESGAPVPPSPRPGPPHP